MTLQPFDLAKLPKWGNGTDPRTWIEKVADGDQPLWMPEDLDGYEWTPEELAKTEAAFGIKKKGDGKVSTLALLEKGHSQIMAYHTPLIRAFDRGVAKLAELVKGIERHAVGAVAHAISEGHAVLEQMRQEMLAAASVAYPKAFRTGLDYARQHSPQQVGADEEAKMVHEAEQRNAAYIQRSLLADVAKRFLAAVDAARGTALIGRTPQLDELEAMAKWAKAEEEPPTPDERVSHLSKSMEQRLAMYASTLWGLLSLGFAVEMTASGGEIEWVTTSGNPCDDCNELEDGSPYGTGNPLPTVPGAGDTECLTRCMCLLDWLPSPGRGRVVSPRRPMYGQARPREAEALLTRALDAMGALQVAPVPVHVAVEVPGLATVAADLGKAVAALGRPVVATMTEPVKLAVELRPPTPRVKEQKVVLDSEGRVEGVDEVTHEPMPTVVLVEPAGKRIRKKRLVKGKDGRVEKIATIEEVGG